MKLRYIEGLKDGIPIGLGYLSVSFGFGIMAIRAGLGVLASVGISLTNLTSAGQVAGVSIITAGGTLLEMMLTQLIINLRYSLMGLTLTQKLDASFTVPQKLICSFGITDEIFAVASVKKEPVTSSYMKGLITLPLVGWTMGTFLGAVAGNILPEAVSAALGIMIYGMFIAIIVPPAKKNLSIAVTAIIAVALSIMFTYLFPTVPSGFSIIISAVTASVITALIFPSPDEKDEATK